jgi:hypothetical protein
MTSNAAAAALRVAAEHGYETTDPIVMQETNNTVVWLRPHPIIAKVGTWPHSAGSLIREHAVAAALAADDSPIARPAGGAQPTRDAQTGFVVTLWDRLDHDPERLVRPGEVGGSLRRLHKGLARYEGELPSFQVGLSRARAVLADDGLMAVLTNEDLSMLRATFDSFRAEVQARSFDQQVLHGEPHDGNFLATPAGVRWIDLEAVCVGPLEWDLAFLPEEEVATFPAFDSELLGLLRTLNSARVATWCWSRADFEEMRRHGEYHLEQVRRAQHR